MPVVRGVLIRGGGSVRGFAAVVVPAKAPAELRISCHRLRTALRAWKIADRAAIGVKSMTAIRDRTVEQGLRFIGTPARIGARARP